jgi:hypothetical protein
LPNERRFTSDCKILPRKGAKSPSSRRDNRFADGILFRNAKQMPFVPTLHRVASRAIIGAAPLLILVSTANLTYAASLNQYMNSTSPVSAGRGALRGSLDVAGPAKRGSTKSGAPTVQGSALSAGAQPSAVETAKTVNRLLAPRMSNPDVPLPQENLAEEPSDHKPLTGPQIYGRGEQGGGGGGLLGGVLGIKIPIPADHGAFDSHTRSGSASSGTGFTQ